MRFLQLVQQQGRWRFDFTSALIGAVIALLVARIIYVRRETIKQFGIKLWSPVAKLRNRLQASQEEKYLSDLQEALKGLLFFEPDDPLTIFQPPKLAAPAPLPTTLPANGAAFPPPLTVAFAHIQDGHPRTIITGPQSSGRTFALAMAAWQTAKRAGKRRPYERFPVWIDLTLLKDVPESDGIDSLERLARLATVFMPGITAKWTLSHLQTEPSLILVDNWDQLAPKTRADTARWIADAAQRLPDSCWLATANETGYGLLNEVDFVPLKLLPASGESTVTALYNGWQQLLGLPVPAPSAGRSPHTAMGRPGGRYAPGIDAPNYPLPPDGAAPFPPRRRPRPFSGQHHPTFKTGGRPNPKLPNKRGCLR